MYLLRPPTAIWHGGGAARVDKREVSRRSRGGIGAETESAPREGTSSSHKEGRFGAACASGKPRHLARDRDLAELLVAMRRHVGVAIVEDERHTRLGDSRLALLVDELIEVGRAHLPRSSFHKEANVRGEPALAN